MDGARSGDCACSECLPKSRAPRPCRRSRHSRSGSGIATNRERPRSAPRTPECPARTGTPCRVRRCPAPEPKPRPPRGAQPNREPGPNWTADRVGRTRAPSARHNKKTMTPEPQEFIRRFLLNVLPRGVSSHPSLRSAHQRHTTHESSACSDIAGGAGCDSFHQASAPSRPNARGIARLACSRMWWSVNTPTTYRCIGRPRATPARRRGRAFDAGRLGRRHHRPAGTAGRAHRTSCPVRVEDPRR